MSQVLLNNLIVKKVTVEEIVNWLQSNDDEVIKLILLVISI